MRLAVRIGVVVIALAACGWFVLGIHQSHDLAAAARIADDAHPTAAAARHADALLTSAAVLNPDQTVAVTRAQLALDRGDTVRARTLLEAVVADEPDNLEAWIELVRASLNAPREREIAFAHALALTNSRLPKG